MREASYAPVPPAVLPPKELGLVVPAALALAGGPSSPEAIACVLTAFGHALAHGLGGEPGPAEAQEMATWLRRLVRAFRADAAWLIVWPPKDGVPASLAHRWVAPGEAAPAREWEELAELPWVAGQVTQDRTVAVGSPMELPPEAAWDRRVLSEAGIGSVVFLPLGTPEGGGGARGALCLATLRREQAWSREAVESLRALREGLGKLVERWWHWRESARVRTPVAAATAEEAVRRGSPRGAVVSSAARKAPLVGSSACLMKSLRQAERVATTDSTVLILGETGTGKELLAKYIHSISRRADKPFVTMNVAAIPATLLESELFGREKGAYTGALTRQAGRFELADGGTLFLDEIGEMPLETQAKLLRVLQSGEFERLGGGRTLRANVRLLAATNRHLPDLIQAGSFRQDLFYRLNVFPITLPPLRERAEDVSQLVWVFVEELANKMGKPVQGIRKEDMDALRKYPWPGNVRELRNVVEHSMILSEGPELHLEVPDAPAGGEARLGPSSMTLEAVEREHVVRVLASTGGRIYGAAGAADVLGLKPTTLYSLMKRLKIDRPARR
jgi:transcriptional regulator with GAF, ATPase, and Fis domain